MAGDFSVGVVSLETNKDDRRGGQARALSMEPPIAKQRSSERLRQKEETGENSASTATAAGPPALVRMNSAQMRTAKAKKMGGGPNSLKTLQKRSAKKPAKSSTPEKSYHTAFHQKHEALLDERDPSERQTDGFMHMKVARDGASRSFGRGMRPGPAKE